MLLNFMFTIHNYWKTCVIQSQSWFGSWRLINYIYFMLWTYDKKTNLTPCKRPPGPRFCYRSGGTAFTVPAFVLPTWHILKKMAPNTILKVFKRKSPFIINFFINPPWMLTITHKLVMSFIFIFTIFNT